MLLPRFAIFVSNKKMSTINKFPTGDSFMSMQNSDICTLVVVVVVVVVVVNLELNTIGYKAHAKLAITFHK